MITFLGDALKGMIPVLIIKFAIGPAVPGLNSELLQLVLGFAVVIGHDFPFFLHFKGGKGIATSAAVMMGFDWRMGLCCLVIFVVVVAATRYVSLASTLLSAALIVEILIFYPGTLGFVCIDPSLRRICDLPSPREHQATDGRNGE